MEISMLISGEKLDKCVNSVHLDRSDVFGIENILYVAQDQRWLAHCPLAQKDNFEIVRSSVRRHD